MTKKKTPMELKIDLSSVCEGSSPEERIFILHSIWNDLQPILSRYSDPHDLQSVLFGDGYVTKGEIK